MALTFKGAKICAKDVITNLTRNADGQMIDASLCFYNAVYTQFGVVDKPQSRLSMSDLPQELLGRFDAILSEIYELNANQIQIESDTAIYPPKEEEPIIPPLDPLPPL